MKHLILTIINDECINCASELAIYFKLNCLNLVDIDGSVVIDWKKTYYYKSGNSLFPVRDNKTWIGDYYSFSGELVLTQKQKIELIRAVPTNAQLFKTSETQDQIIISELLKIAAGYASDYYASNRSFEQDKSYRNTVSNFNMNFAERFGYADQCTKEEIIIELGSKISKVAPKLLDVVSEYVGIYDLSYNVLEFNVNSGILYLSTNGDWRIQQWEENKRSLELLKNINYKEELLAKQNRLDELTAINIAIDEEHKNAEFRERLRNIRNNERKGF